MAAVTVSVVIKALNEERNIARAVDSALRAVAPVGGEVILADSCSSDRTVEIASAYPIVIVELGHPQERCCGIGPQLGYQHARGEFIYVLDGDMEMHPGFLEAALAQFAADPQLGGVGGIVVEKNLDSMEYQARVERAPANFQPGVVDRLDMGGLYRRSAIEQIGYLTDRNLHSYEEFDLGIRLRARGWTLRRIAVNAVDHYGHTTDAVTLLLRRWRNGYVWGIGEVLRASLGHPHGRLLLRELRELHLYLAVLGWWAALLLVWLLPAPLATRALCCAALALFPLVVMTLKKRSLARAAYSVFAWGVAAAGLVRGFLRPRVSAAGPIASQQRHNALAD
jgi:glycosyltransferase involved in cell wall biosynthesis